MNPGAHIGVSVAEYDRIPALRSTVLRELALGTPAHAHYKEQHGSKETREMLLGRCLHAAVLEPDLFDSQYLVVPHFGDYRSPVKRAERDAWKAERAGCTFIEVDDLELIKSWREGLYQHPLIGSLLVSRGQNELTLVWDDPIGPRCKARLDRLASFEGRAAIVEVKTSRSAAKWSFGRDVLSMGYHVQAGFYIRGLEQVYGEARRRFMFAVVEKDAPYLAAAYELTQDQMDICRRDAALALSAYARCEASGVWPGYSDELQELEFPDWKMQDAPDRGAED